MHTKRIIKIATIILFIILISYIVLLGRYFLGN